MEPTTNDELVLGRTVKGALDHVQTLPARPEVYSVTAIANEVTARCPVTDQPDIYEVTIRYRPEGRIIESKSLKMYLLRWRDVGISCEDLAGAIAADLARDLGAPVEVETVQNVRGGIVLRGSAYAGGGEES